MWTVPALTAPPLPGHVEEMGAPADRQKVLFNHEGAQGEISKGGNKAGKVYPAVPSTPKTDSPGRLRLANLEAGFSSFKTEIASMFATLTGRLTASHPPDYNTEWIFSYGRIPRGVGCIHNGNSMLQMKTSNENSVPFEFGKDDLSVASIIIFYTVRHEITTSAMASNYCQNRY